MNQSFVAAVKNLAETKIPCQDAEDQLTLTRNIGLLLHCSHEIDQSTVLYLTVNGFPLLESDSFLFLFSENSLPDEEQNRGHGLYHRAFLYGVLERVVRDTLRGHFNFCTCQLDGRLVAIVNFARQLLPAIEPGIKEKLRGCCYQIINEAHRLYDLQVSVHCSGLIRQMEDLSAAYHRLLNEVTFFRYTGADMTALVSGFSTLSYYSFHEIAVQTAAHAQALIQQMVDGKETDEYLHQTLQGLCDTPPYSISVLQTRLQSLLEAINLELQNRNILLPECQQIAAAFDTISTASSMEVIEQNIQACITELRDAYHQRLQDGGFQHIQAVEQYIMQHLQEPGLTLREIAEAFGDTPSALTAKFKEYYQDTLYVFLQKKRLELAVTYLNSSMTIREIAAACGFGSVESLYRAFRKEYGITPNQMRKHR